MIMVRVMAFGTFDRLHPGHRYYLREAKHHGDELVVVVARDATVQQVKGHAPQQSETARLAAVRSVPEVDAAMLGEAGDKYDVIRRQQPQVLCLGYDQQAFTDDLPRAFPQLKIVRLPPHHPERYHTSKLERSKSANFGEIPSTKHQTPNKLK